MVVELQPGISAMQWAGVEQKNLPKACVPEVELHKFVTVVELGLNAGGRHPKKHRRMVRAPDSIRE